MEEFMNIFTINLTGGPNAGKTEVFKGIIPKLKESGYYPIVIPETATEIMLQNIFPGASREHTKVFQSIVIEDQLLKYQHALKYAKFINENEGINNIVIIFDRGIPDNIAYFNYQEDYYALLKDYNLNHLAALNLYGLVINLISTAALRPEFYEQTTIRREDITLAKKLDYAISESYKYHPNIHYVKPTDTIDEKVQIVYDIIQNYITGLKQTPSLITTDDLDTKPILITEYTFNKDQPEHEFRICKRTLDAETNYLLYKKSANSITIDSDIEPIDENTFTLLTKLFSIDEINSYEESRSIKNGDVYQKIKKINNK